MGSGYRRKWAGKESIKVAVRLDRTGYQGAISIELEDHQFLETLEA
ncbi:hypothetical protein KZ483_15720 [Paenibacillus sp. sptzw28]|nr:hypothetical protein [Paenibacillus sp. sptzw28]QYR19377.1 hypothetical protein KZ483_15720 [Paenibacillus sp. sptzw28]